MSKLYKLILLLVLIGLSIIISTAIVALRFVHGRRKVALKKHLIEKSKNTRFTSSSSSNTNNNNNNNRGQQSSNGNTKPKYIFLPSEAIQTTIKDTNPLHPNDLHLHKQHIAPDGMSSSGTYTSTSGSSSILSSSTLSQPILLGEAHLGLALRDIPYEIHDTHKHYPPVELGTWTSSITGSGSITDVMSSGGSASSDSSNGGGDTTASTAALLSSRFGGNAIPPELRYGAIVPQDQLENVNKQFNHNYKHDEKKKEKRKESSNDDDTNDITNDDKVDDEEQNENDDNNLIPTIPNVNSGLKRRGVEFVKTENPIKGHEGSGKIRQIAYSSQDFYNKQKQKQQQQQHSFIFINGIRNWFSNLISSSSSTSGRSKSGSRRKKSTAKTNTTSTTSSTSSSSDSKNIIHHKYAKEHSILYHLQKASEYGNHHAQNMIANSLASGILPIHNHPSIREHLNITLDVTSDFSGSTSTKKSKGGSSNDNNNNNNDQLSKAILLWHMSAMEGNIESLMALGYRHYISATSRSNSLQKILVHDNDLKLIEGSSNSGGKQQQFSSMNAGSTIGTSSASQRGKKQSPVRHSPQESHHYGVLGTCESSLAYYEEAVNHIMDELESGPLRGKVSPAVDAHILPEIRQRGSSSALSHNNKPDELEEALKFMEMRALRKDEPDTSSAYKLASMYHYGLRGVKQDLRMALKYYEIGAENNSWECAGQAGKFYMFGMGIEDDERDLEKAHRFFQSGMPGGISTCEDRQMKKEQNTHKDQNDDDDYDGDDDEYEEEYGNLWEKKIYQCDHPSVNGMGLLYIFGVPGKVVPNLKTAVRHFELAMKLGNMDAMYNLGMLRLGWNNPYYDDLFQHSGTSRNSYRSSTKKRGPSTSGFLEATGLFTAAAEMGHLQAKHRLGMIYSKGFQIENAVKVKPDCKKALSTFKGIATTVGTTVTKRMRAAYKQYVAGDYESSLRNYLAAAETGSIEAQVNAAFLLEEGYCLGMDHLQCMKASVRLWRAAAKMGHGEAYLRVGDFYYYGRLREDIKLDDRKSVVAQRDIEFGLSPLPWVRYILYPEDLIPKGRKAVIKFIRWALEQRNTKSSQTCSVDEGEKGETCVNRTPQSTQHKNEILSEEQRDHFKIAAKYYRTAAVELQSARANFNLGFMHEWGLGLSQDFYLAKRYYDLAAEQAKTSGDGVVANQIALFCMNLHEYLLKQRSAFDEWMSQTDDDHALSSDEPIPGEAVQASGDLASIQNTRFGVIMYHILTWESALIFLFTFVLSRLVQHRHNRNMPQR